MMLATLLEYLQLVAERIVAEHTARLVTKLLLLPCGHNMQPQHMTLTAEGQSVVTNQPR